MSEELTQRKISIVAALWANTNMDSKEADREGTIAKIEEGFDLAIRSLYDGVVSKEEGIDLSEDPFFAAMKVPTLTYDTGGEPESMNQGGGS